MCVSDAGWLDFEIISNRMRHVQITVRNAMTRSTETQKPFSRKYDFCHTKKNKCILYRPIKTKSCI